MSPRITNRVSSNGSPSWSMLVCPDIQDRHPGPQMQIPAFVRARHAHISTTQQIYTHVDEAARREALTRLKKLLGGTE